MRNLTMNDLENTIREINSALDANPEWEKRYADYLNDLDKNQKLNSELRKKFHVPSYFTCHTNLNNEKNAKAALYLRYLGQQVCEMNIDKDNDVVFSPAKANIDYFKCGLQGKNLKWNSGEGKFFRKHFEAYNFLENNKLKSPEHRAEASLLKEFSKKSSSEKSLCNIQPVMLSNAFFQMPTPISASTAPFSYAYEKGGGIDILARAKMKEKSETRLTVFELKPDRKVAINIIPQAIAYATFIARLLQKQAEWWKVFGYADKDNTKNPKTINVATLLPPHIRKQNMEFENMLLPVAGTDFTLQLHTLFFNEEMKLTGGSFIESIARHN